MGDWGGKLLSLSEYRYAKSWLSSFSFSSKLCCCLFFMCRCTHCIMKKKKWRIITEGIQMAILWVIQSLNLLLNMNMNDSHIWLLNQFSDNSFAQGFPWRRSWKDMVQKKLAHKMTLSWDPGKSKPMHCVMAQHEIIWTAFKMLAN